MLLVDDSQLGVTERQLLRGDDRRFTVWSRTGCGSFGREVEAVFTWSQLTESNRKRTRNSSLSSRPLGGVATGTSFTPLSKGGASPPVSTVAAATEVEMASE